MKDHFTNSSPIEGFMLTYFFDPVYPELPFIEVLSHHETPPKSYCNSRKLYRKHGNYYNGKLRNEVLRSDDCQQFPHE